eukprot:TRINITY_DN3880_c0_g1_i8.p1 TRINITY_DN3880_c0_g1~~TRINITY_DN3880_c0_g1_i8.p1  ORF type:complete len:620 (-),score=126.64 TRINITY_DN3880_c0_g1_i8:613-2472(-)
MCIRDRYQRRVRGSKHRTMHSLSLAHALVLLVGGIVGFEYCIVGAGPGGLQLASLMHAKQRDYVVFERANASGSFFDVYPRHRRLNSFHRPSDKLWLDQHSLLHRANLSVGDFLSGEAHPQAGQYARYLRAFSAGLNIRYNADAVLSRAPAGAYMVRVGAEVHQCAVAVVATGLGLPNRVHRMRGAEHLEYYSSMNTDPHNYTNQSVMIMGTGNSGFETAAALADHAAQVWVVGRSRLKLAMESGYSGDVRSAVNGILDSYHLKSLDAVAEHKFEGKTVSVVRDESQLKLVAPKMASRYTLNRAWREAKAAKVLPLRSCVLSAAGPRGGGGVAAGTPARGCALAGATGQQPEQALHVRRARRGRRRLEPGAVAGRSHHRVLRCAARWAADSSTGFRFNESLFTGSSAELCSRRPCGSVPLGQLVQVPFLSGPVHTLYEPDPADSLPAPKAVQYPWRSFPELTSWYGLHGHEGLYFAGVLMHGADFRRASGNMVHGFRHSVEALHHWLELQRHQQPWPRRLWAHSTEVHHDAAHAVLWLASEAAASRSMHGALVDVLCVPEDQSMVHSGCRCSCAAGESERGATQAGRASGSSCTDKSAARVPDEHRDRTCGCFRAQNPT